MIGFGLVRLNDPVIPSLDRVLIRSELLAFVDEYIHRDRRLRNLASLPDHDIQERLLIEKAKAPISCPRPPVNSQIAHRGALP
jgi:hypothetical protein